MCSTIVNRASKKQRLGRLKTTFHCLMDWGNVCIWSVWLSFQIYSTCGWFKHWIGMSSSRVPWCLSFSDEPKKYSILQHIQSPAPDPKNSPGSTEVITQEMSFWQLQNGLRHFVEMASGQMEVESFLPDFSAREKDFSAAPNSTSTTHEHSAVSQSSPRSHFTLPATGSVRRSSTRTWRKWPWSQLRSLAPAPVRLAKSGALRFGLSNRVDWFNSEIASRVG